MGKRGKPSIFVDRSLLEKTIQTLEAAQSFSNRSQLFDAVVTDYNKTAGVPINSPIVYLRVKAWDISLKTPKGKPGRSGGNPTLGTAVRVPRSVKFQDESIKASVKELKRVTDTKHSGLIKRASGGSLRASITLKCLDCACEDKKSIRSCPILGCPLWPHRPYQNKESNKQVIDSLEE